MTSPRPRFHRSRALLAVAAWLLPACMFPQARLLDEFETLAGWRAVPSEGARMGLATAEGRNGHALMLEFDLSGAYGYASARKDFSIDLPDNYQFTFDLRADAPVNNLEFKLIDAEGNTWWIKKLDVTFPTQWTPQHIRRRQLTFAWGPSGGAEIRHIKTIELVVSSGTGGKGPGLLRPSSLRTHRRPGRSHRSRPGGGIRLLIREQVTESESPAWRNQHRSVLACAVVSSGCPG